ncbi:MAG: universal stress protein [Candidatus Methanofastidiosia archaeon]
MTIKKILVPIDDSVIAPKLVREAVMLAEKFSAEVKVLHVIDYTSITDFEGSYLGVTISGDLEEAIEQQARELVKSAVKKFRAAGIKVSKKLLRGRPSLKICELAERENFDLIVLGSQGASKLERMLLGSTSERVVRMAKVPVLLIPRDWEVEG